MYDFGHYGSLCFGQLWDLILVSKISKCMINGFMLLWLIIKWGFRRENLKSLWQSYLLLFFLWNGYFSRFKPTPLWLQVQDFCYCTKQWYLEHLILKIYLNYAFTNIFKSKCISFCKCIFSTSLNSIWIVGISIKVSSCCRYLCW